MFVFELKTVCVKYISATAALYLKCNYLGMTTVSFFLVKIISIPDEELFYETYVMCTASYYV